MNPFLANVLALASLATAAAAQTGGPAIAYLATNSNAIKVMNDDGSGQTTVYVPGTSTSPSLSPDGQQVSFCATIGGQKGVYVVNSNGTGLHLVTPLSDTMPHLLRAAWSPVPTLDGQYKLLFRDWSVVNPYFPVGQVDLFVVNLDGSGRTQLTNDNLTEGYPEWSQDATRVVWARDTAMQVSQLGLVAGQLVLTSTQEVTNLAGSPLQAASTLAFCGWANTADTLLVSAITADSGGNFDLWSIPLATPTAPTRLTNTPRSSERWATFTSNDSRIVFHGSKGVMTMNPNGTGVVQLYNNGWRPNHRRR